MCTWLANLRAPKILQASLFANETHYDFQSILLETLHSYCFMSSHVRTMLIYVVEKGLKNHYLIFVLINN